MSYPVASIVAVDTVSAVVLIVTIVANLGITLADFASAKFVLKNSAEVGVSTKWLPILGALKAAGAVGLLLGLLGVRPIGIAAALGLVAFFIGAVATHLRPPSVLQHRLSNGVSGPGDRLAGGVVTKRSVSASPTVRLRHGAEAHAQYDHGRRLRSEAGQRHAQTSLRPRRGRPHAPLRRALRLSLARVRPQVRFGL
jgi:hypothetical protein